MLAARRTPHRRGLSGARSTIGLLLVAGLTLAAVGATAAQAETPAQKIARLRAEAAKVQRTIDRMNNQVETVVEQFNANQEALKKTVERQRATARRLRAARERLADSQRVMDERIRAIYIDGPVTRLGQLLEVQTVADAVTMAHYQQSVTDADVEAIANVDQSRRELTSVADTLASQQRQQETIRAKLSSQRHDIERRLAKQRAYLDRLSDEVKQAVQEEQRRQEELRRQALERKLAAERAAREQAAREAAAQEAAQQEASQTSTEPSSAAEQAIAFAKAQLGEPYQWGATGPDSWDCSGLTMMAYQSAGVSIPRTSREQWTFGTHIDSMADLLPGDLVFFASGSDPSTIHHVGLYIGDGEMIHAPHTGDVVSIDSINRDDYYGATRVS
ncbi:MAG TPA: NlpC/P60 family protein [Actinomycetota bacterium]|nr:NlpC/P60 family protein [Actinomycetota bacterium]